MTTNVSRVALEAAKAVYLAAHDALITAINNDTVDMATVRNMADDAEAKHHAYRVEVHAYRKACGFYAVAA